MLKVKLDVVEFKGKIISEGIQESPINGLKYVDGMVARDGIPNGKDIKELSNKLNKKYGIFNKYSELLKNTKNNAVLSILKYCAKNGTQDLEKNVVEPLKIGIKTKYFGSNKRKTIERKGFDQLMVDTGAFYKSLKLKITK